MSGQIHPGQVFSRLMVVGEWKFRQGKDGRRHRSPKVIVTLAEIKAIQAKPIWPQ
jgi:hypothetical protein